MVLYYVTIIEGCYYPGGYGKLDRIHKLESSLSYLSADQCVER